MSEMNYVDFKPRWMRELSAEERQPLEETPLTGSPSDVPPRINTHILPLGGVSKLSARTLVDVLAVKQSLVQYAGHDVCHGINPDFADLRSLSTEVVALTKLTVEPFEEGSFVIPARLEAEPLELQEKTTPHRVTTEAVANRFGELLVAFQQAETPTQVSIGAIQALESLGRALRREAEAIEFSSFDALGEPTRTIRVDGDYVARVSHVRQSRQPTRAAQDTLEGRITALDIREGKLQLSIEGQRRRVQGNISPLFLPTLVECLGRRVRLQGHVEWKGRTPVSIQVISFELPSDEG